MKPSARVTVAGVSLAVGLAAVVVGPVAADEHDDAGGQSQTPDDEGERGGDALEKRKGHGHAYGLTERPSDGGGLARGHAKNGGPHGQAGGRPDGEDGPAGERRGGHAPGEESRTDAATDPAHAHGKGKAPGHSHGTEHGPGHVHVPDDETTTP